MQTIRHRMLSARAARQLEQERKGWGPGSLLGGVFLPIRKPLLQVAIGLALGGGSGGEGLVEMLFGIVKIIRLGFGDGEAEDELPVLPAVGFARF